MSILLGNSGIRNVKEIYIGVNGNAKKVKEGYVGVGGVPKLFYKAGTPIGNLPVGNTVTLKVDGVPTDFIIVQQGNPDANFYDASCDGTWLLMEDIYELRAWHNSDLNNYETSDIHNYLNGDFLSLFETPIRNAIKGVKIPYRSGAGASTTPINSGANGLSCKIFLLSGYELGWTTTVDSSFPIDGAKLSYFDSGAGDKANQKRIANLRGNATTWWTRSPTCFQNTYARMVFHVSTNGKWSDLNCSRTCGIRPALILPSSFSI